MSAADRIAETILEEGRIRAQGLQQAANARAQAQAQQGQIWGGALAQLGQLPLEIQKAKLADTENQIRQQQLGQAKQQQNDEFNANQIFAYTTRPTEDGSTQFNEDRFTDLTQRMAAAGVNPETQQRMINGFKQGNEVVSSFRQEQLAHQAKFAQAVLDSATPDNPLTAGTALAAAKVAQANGLGNAQDIDHFMSAIQQGHDPTDIFKAIVKAGTQPQSLKPPTNDAELRFLAAGGNPQAKAALQLPNQPKTPEAAKGISNETELELAAADPNHPQHAAAIATLAARPSKEPKPPTTEEDNARAVTIRAKLLAKAPVSQEDQLWLKSHETEKTLGVDTSASAAAIRQAATIGAQVAQQGRAQNFQEAEAGRKALDKIEAPYLDAKEKAATLRNVIDAAKGGNMAAGNVQSLLATLGLVTMEGVKRINTTELEQVQGAGSLLERLKGSIGGLVAGKPLSPKIQQDLTQLAGMLEKSARSKYEQGFKQTVGRYPLPNEKMIPDDSVPGAAPAGTSALSSYQDYLRAKGQK